VCNYSRPRLLTPTRTRCQDNTTFEGRTRYHRQVPANFAAAVTALVAAHAAGLDPTAVRTGADTRPPGGASSGGADAQLAGGNSAQERGHHGGGATGAGGLVGVVGLGDWVDGYPGAADNVARSEADLTNLVLPQIARLEAAGVPVWAVLGNHDLAVPRPRLLAALRLPEGSRGWYSAALAPGWRLVVLDTTDVSVYGSIKVGRGRMLR
jgi:hypothetical protein